MKLHLTSKQVDQVLEAIGNWTIDAEILKQNFSDKGRALLRAEKTLLRARLEEKEKSSKKFPNKGLN